MIKHVIVIDDCMECPFVGKCKPWKKLDKKHRFELTCAVGINKFILKGCPLPEGDQKLEVFKGI